MATTFKNISSKNQESANTIYSKLSTVGRRNFKSTFDKSICHSFTSDEYEKLINGTLENAKAKYENFKQCKDDFDTHDLYMSLINHELFFQTLIHIINFKNNVATKAEGEFEIKKWYGKNIAKDEIWKSINKGVTFNDCYNTLINGCGYHIYELIGANSAIVRENIFNKIAEIYNIDYSELYEMWMNK